MKKLAAALLTLALLISPGCKDANNTGGGFTGEASVVTDNAASSNIADNGIQSEAVQSGGEAGYPEEAAKYLEMSLDGSALVYFNRAGEHGELLLPDANYSEARMSPDGNHILCKTNAGGAGEAAWCGYSVVSLITNPAETYAFDGAQWGYQNHLWLDNDLIGFADGGVIGGQEGIWKSVQIFDERYNPVDITPEILMTNPGIAGIGYDKANKQYIVAHAESMPASTIPFNINRLMLTVLDANGEFVKEIGLPDGYQSLYSPNLRTLVPNNPVVTSEGHILITAQKQSEVEQNNYNNRVLLVLSAEDRPIQELPYGDTLRLSADGKTAFAIGYDADNNRMKPAVLSFEAGQDAAVQELPEHFTAEGYSGEFVPFDGAIRDSHVYIMSENYTEDWELFSGLFYWNIAEDKNAEKIELLQIFPGRDYCNLAGVGGEGFAYVLINGTVPESAGDDADVHEQLKEKREWILTITGSKSSHN